MDTPATDEEFNAKLEEVVGNLGVAIGAVVTAPADVIRDHWRTLGRSFAELIAMEPPR